METNDKINLLSVLLFLLTGILHLISPLIYGTTIDTTGLILFGIIYTLLGILVYIKKENKLIGILSIICPIIGVTLGTIFVIAGLLPGDAFLIFVLLLDPIIIILRIYLYKQ
jgi:hypothetical protein